MEALIKRFKMDLHNCVGFIQDYKKLKAGIRELYTKYVQQLEMVSQRLCLLLTDEYL